MSIQSPPTLLELAGRSLLSDKSRAILDLEDLPIELFPPLFVEAFSRGHTEVLKKMVQAWPFTYLPLGALMRKPQLEMIRVALEGLDMLLAQQDRSRLRIFGKPTSHTRKVLRLLQWDSVKKVEVQCTWAPSTLAAYAPFLGQMRNLWKLLVSQVHMPAHTSPEEQEHLKTPLETLSITNCPLSHSDWNYLSCCPNTSQLRHLDLSGILFLLACFYGAKPGFPPQSSCTMSLRSRSGCSPKLTSQFLRMDFLRKFCVDAVLLHEGHLEQVRRKLRHLELRGIKLTNFSPEPLQILLETVAATLKSLDLETCRITDFQLQALLPALSYCSQLRVLSFHGNRISMSARRDLLPHTARLSQLSIELYPAPLESYDAQGAIHPGRCSQLCAELTAIVRDFRQPKVLVFCTVPCPQCGSMFLYNQSLLHCSCPTAA
ncbi:PRAME family member 12-like [Ictidomys tridecemlineatus]|uniref:PRAME family member 12-like n=1 Tax=Ictidomys tridecemlineatus TaxID=43179 RepID=UPI000B54570E|nr:PRAME family member 12-like [Ictidomys tridecemlineatus]KAG3283652.1 PRAME family member 12-like [Ictidomys tridecemlineatus]